MNRTRFFSIASAAAIILLLASLYGAQSVNLFGSPNLAAQPASIQPAITHPVHYTHPFVAASTSAVANVPSPCPLPTAQCWASINWGGYAITNTTNPSALLVTDVKASWVVPKIVGSTTTTCPDSQRTWDSNSIWVGIDGFSNGYVEQTGTSSDCFYGQASYYAWYEMYPAGSVPITNTVNPGDHITAEVTYQPSTGLFTTIITDVTGHWTFTSTPTTNCAAPGVCAPADSAEFIDESPYYNGFLGLTQVPQITFSSATATINGVTAPISAWGANVNWLQMVDYNWGPVSLGYGGETLFYTKGLPLALSTPRFSTGSSFSVNWISSGP